MKCMRVSSVPPWRQSLIPYELADPPFKLADGEGSNESVWEKDQCCQISDIASRRWALRKATQSNVCGT